MRRAGSRRVSGGGATFRGVYRCILRVRVRVRVRFRCWMLDAGCRMGDGIAPDPETDSDTDERYCILARDHSGPRAPRSPRVQSPRRACRARSCASTTFRGRARCAQLRCRATAELIGRRWVDPAVRRERARRPMSSFGVLAFPVNIPSQTIQPTTIVGGRDARGDKRRAKFSESVVRTRASQSPDAGRRRPGSVVSGVPASFVRPRCPGDAGPIPPPGGDGPEGRC